MSLWTPYADAVLDLSVSVKKERVSPPPNLYHSEYCREEPLHIQPPPYFYPYPEEYRDGSRFSQFSPHSASSTCSYEAPSVVPSQSTSLSPPDSPDRVEAIQTGKIANTLTEDPEFRAFERDALRAMAEKNGGSLLGNNPRMRRAVRATIPNCTDDSYRKQRERNNYAAKQSRDRRKLREVRLALEVTYLSKKVNSLKARLASNLCARCHQPDY